MYSDKSKIFEHSYLIMQGKVCPYCNSVPEYVDSSEVYGRSFGMIYLCRDCKAWVGVHEGTDVALGRLANEELREAKMLTHKWLERIFTEDLINKIYPRYIHGISNRQKTYTWLSEQMGIKKEFCHIGMFDVGECKQATEICKSAIDRLNNNQA
jgi:hypothetical protein